MLMAYGLQLIAYRSQNLVSNGIVFNFEQLLK